MEFKRTTIGTGDGNPVNKSVGTTIETSHPAVIFGFTCDAQTTFRGAWIFKCRVGKTTSITIVEVHCCAKEINPLNGYAVRIFNANGKWLDLDTQIQIVRILATRCFVVQTTVSVVKPPFTVNIYQFTLTFQKVGVVFILPRNS